MEITRRNALMGASAAAIVTGASPLTIKVAGAKVALAGDPVVALAAQVNLDIYRTANVIIKQHGEDAPIDAAMRADAMIETGDLDGYAVWKRILRAVEELQGAAAKSGEAVH